MQSARGMIEATDPQVTAIKGSAQAHRVIGREVYDFYTCQRCRTLLTQRQVIKRLTKGGGRLCRCGGMKVSPASPGGFGVRWYHFLRPDVTWFTLARIGSLALAKVKRVAGYQE